MLYNVENKMAMLDNLEKRLSSIVDICVALANEGYAPNKNKYSRLSWTVIMIDAIENIDVLSVEQQNNIETLYSKIV